MNDKLLHFIVSAIMVIVAQFVMPLIYAALLALLVGVVKELVYDKMLNRGKCSLADVIADIAGIVFACLLV